MTDEEREKMREWINNWKETGEVLEKLRYSEMLRLNITEEILSLDDASESALQMYPPLPTSGLIEMQRLFKKMKK